MRRVTIAGVLAGSGCVGTVQDGVEVPLFVAGTAVQGPIAGKDGVQIELSSAELAFGPLYLCAGAQAGELCETARLEWLDSAVVDALDPAAAEVGALEGVSGTVRSWMYDVGYSSLLTEEAPLRLDAATELDGASVRLVGVATVGELALPFRAAVVVQAEEGTEAGVPLVRSSADSGFDHEVEAGEAGLLVRFDAAPWIAEIDFNAYVGSEGCVVDGPVVACEGTLESHCDASGAAVSQRDCADTGEICVPGLGCAPELVIEQGQGALAIRNQLVAGPRPSFEWEVGS